MQSNDTPVQPGASANIAFLFNSCTNTQQTIQFFDKKAGVIVAVNGILASLISQSLVKVLDDLSFKNSFLSKYMLSAAVGGLALLFLYHIVQVFYQSFMVLRPRTKSATDDKGSAIGLFWAGDLLEYLQQRPIDQYADKIALMNQHDIIVELCYETAVLAHIITTKLEYLRHATSHFQWVIILWAILLFGISVLEILLPGLL
jgi:hypothetical protein